MNPAIAVADHAVSAEHYIDGERAGSNGSFEVFCPTGPRANSLGIGFPPSDTPAARRVALGTDANVPEHLKQNYRAANRCVNGSDNAI